jgi:hypothetical protein
MQSPMNLYEKFPLMSFTKNLVKHLLDLKLESGKWYQISVVEEGFTQIGAWYPQSLLQLYWMKS